MGPNVTKVPRELEEHVRPAAVGWQLRGLCMPVTCRELGVPLVQLGPR